MDLPERFSRWSHVDNPHVSYVVIRHIIVKDPATREWVPHAEYQQCEFGQGMAYRTSGPLCARTAEDFAARFIPWKGGQS